MKLQPNQLYHIYNRGNNRQKIFFDKENYEYFLKKVKKYLAPNCDILAYCLMPNHFHFLIHANERTIMPHKNSRQPSSNRRRRRAKRLTLFSRGLQQLLSSYAKGINKQLDRTGSLFQQNTKFKMTSSASFMDDYSLWCFIYIHNNPVKSGLVNSPIDYEYTSFKDFLEDNKNSICNLDLARQLLSLDKNELFDLKLIDVPVDIVGKLFK